MALMIRGAELASRLVLPVVLFAGALAMIAASPSGDGAAYSCTTIPPVGGNTTLLLLPVVSTMSWTGPSGICPSGQDFVSVAPACATAGPAPGAYCGPVVPGFGVAMCEWAAQANTLPTGLVIGFDLTGDGHILASDGELPVTKPLPAGNWLVTNPYPSSAEVIAYPTSTVGEPNPSPPLSGNAPAEINAIMCI